MGITLKTMKQLRSFLLLLVFLAVALSGSYGQQVTKSKIIETIDGRDFYIHFVRKGETLYNIAHTYDVTVNDIFRFNPLAGEGIREGSVLKIPVKQIQPYEKEPPKNEITVQGDKTSFLHIVSKGETLYGIARRYHVTVDEIKALNPTYTGTIKAGDVLHIPVKEADSGHAGLPPAHDEIAVHEVKAGETLYSIARQYNVSIGEIINTNPGLDPASLKIGQKLLIPGQMELTPPSGNNQSAAPDTNRYHIVQPGETLYAISRLTGVPVDSLMLLNPGLGPVLKPGQKILLPNQEKRPQYIIHTSQRRESVSEIAKKYQVQPEKIYLENPGLSRKVRRGTRVRIPVAEPKVEKPAETEPEPEEEIIPADCIAGNTSRLDRPVNVALMIPLALEDADTLVQYYKETGELMSSVSMRFMPFYAGFRMAADSLNNSGMPVNLFVYDVDQNISKVQEVLNRPELADMDLVVGPFYSAAFREVSKWALDYHIPVVNPLTRREEVIYNNPWVIKYKPDESVLPEIVAGYIAENYRNEKITIIRHNAYSFTREVSWLSNTLNSRLPLSVKVSHKNILKVMKETEETKLLTEDRLFDKKLLSAAPGDSALLPNRVKEVIFVNDSINGLTNNLSLIRPNIVIAFTNEPVFTTTIISQLNKFTRSPGAPPVTLYLLPEWNDLNRFESSQLMRLNLHYFTSSDINGQAPRIGNWIREFRREFRTDPTRENYAIDGFETGYFFIKSKHLLGDHFTDCLSSFRLNLIGQSPRFYRENGHGFVNRYWNFMKIEDYQTIPIPYTLPVQSHGEND
ncbi:MAG: LysM peptidoglycan-binding domain-containing protein [Bacteroidales bacterium]